MLAGDKGKSEPAALQVRCGACGLTFASESEKQKHMELEHMKKRRPAGVR